MNQEEIRNTVVRILKNIAPDTDPGQLKPDDNIRQVLEIDSFDYLQFIVALDEHFGIDTPEKDYGRISSLNSLSNYLLDKSVMKSG